MTYMSDESKVIYQGNGVATPYPTTFTFLQNSHVRVMRSSAELTEGTDYQLSGGDGEAGTVSLLGAPLAIDETLTIWLDPPIRQDKSLGNLTTLDLNEVEEAFDLLTMICKAQQEQLDRSVKVRMDSEIGPADYLATVISAAGEAVAAQVAAETAEGLADAARVLAQAAQDAAEADAAATAADRLAIAADKISASGFKDAAAASAVAAAGSANTASSHKDAAAASAAAASGSAAAASGHKDAAAASAGSANAARVEAEAARDATLAAYDSFDDRYLGTKASDPTTDNDGAALTAGMIYFKTGVGMMIYTGSAWAAAYISGTGYLAAANDLSDVHSAATARANLGLGSSATRDAGTAANQVLLLDAGGKIPAVPGDQLTGISDADGRDQIAMLVMRALAASALTKGGKAWLFGSDEWATGSSNYALASGSPGYYTNATGTSAGSTSSTGWTSNSATFGADGHVTANNFNLAAYRTAAELAGDFDFSYTQSSVADDGNGATGATAAYQFGVGTTVPSGVINSPYANATSGMWYMTHLGPGSGRTITFYNNQTSVGTVTATIAAGDVFTFRRRGTTLTVLQNGTTIYTFSGFSSSATLYAILGFGRGGNTCVLNNVTWKYNISVGNMTLVSDAVSASISSVPSRLYVYFLHKDDSGSATMGTDFTIEGSRNGGTTFTSASTYTNLLGVAGYDGTYTLWRATIDVSGQSSAANVEVRAKSLNTKAQRFARPLAWAA